ncbi:hypothetical protein H8959_008294, partial [Pygathrix nigripes]
MRAALPGVPATLPPPTHLRDRCRWSGAGRTRAAAAAVAPARGASGPTRSGSGSFGGGGACCRAFPPVNCLRPRATRLATQRGGRRKLPPPQSPRPAEGRGELWRFRVSAGGDSLGTRRARVPVPSRGQRRLRQ